MTFSSDFNGVDTSIGTLSYIDIVSNSSVSDFDLDFDDGFVFFPTESISWAGADFRLTESAKENVSKYIIKNANIRKYSSPGFQHAFIISSY